jgi:hypothetical protein
MLLRIMKILLSLFLYIVGDMISRPMIRFDWAWLHPFYQIIMKASLRLDKECKVWKKI